MKIRHEMFIKDLQNKSRGVVRVIFLVVHGSVWKVDSVFKRMLVDPYFEPEILICPYIPYGEERMLKEMERTYVYFRKKGYPVRKARRVDGSWVKLDETKPDIVFLTNPYEITRRDYYKAAYSNYLSCYVPYYFMATRHAGDERVEYNNELFVNAWKLYWPHSLCERMHKEISLNNGRNGLTVGYPAVEHLYRKKQKVADKNTWKNQSKTLKRIIYAPHHTIEGLSNSLSTFMNFSEIIQALAIEYQNSVQWSFKPHPILKDKLYLHPLWGKEKTDKYYKFWHEERYTQLDEGDYDDLFLSSDAIIHDCSSFIVEYAFTLNPCLFLTNENNLYDILNEFGKGVISIYEVAKTAQEIESFVIGVITSTIKVDKFKLNYFNNYVENYYAGMLPSERIIEDIKKSLGISSGHR